MSQQHIFTPVYGSGELVAPTTSSASIAIEKATGQKQFVVTNLGLVTCYVSPSIGSKTATTADYPILPSTKETLTKDQLATTFNYVSESGTGSLHIIPGEGF